MSGLTYTRPLTIQEAITALIGSDGALPLSGGTDLAVGMRHGSSTPEVLVDLKAIPELASSIELEDGVFEIAANTVMTDLENDARVRTELPGLVEAAEVVGSVQIRNRATLAGNLCNASPAADTPPVLIALGASVAVQGPAGARMIPVDEFFTGYRATALTSGELITAVHVAQPPPGSGSAFLKLGVRRAMEISIVCVGASLHIGPDGVIVSAGLGLGSVAPQTIRPEQAVQTLIGERPSEDLFAAAGAEAAQACSPIDDLRASGEYRRAMVSVLVRRALTRSFERARERT